MKCYSALLQMLFTTNPFIIFFRVLKQRTTICALCARMDIGLGFVTFGHVMHLQRAYVLASLCHGASGGRSFADGV